MQCGHRGDGLADGACLEECVGRDGWAADGSDTVPTRPLDDAMVHDRNADALNMKLLHAREQRCACRFTFDDDCGGKACLDLVDEIVCAGSSGGLRDEKRGSEEEKRNRNKAAK